MTYSYDRRILAAETRTQKRIERSNLPGRPTYPAAKKGPESRAAQRKELELFNNIADVQIDRTRSAYVWSFKGTKATAQGAARIGFHVWKVPGSTDTYWALAKVD